MLERVPQFIDFIRYTDARKTINGDLRISDCSRLVDLLSPESPLDKKIQIDFDFGVDEFANRYLKGKLKTNVLLTCQRCMQVMDYGVEVNLALAFINNKSDEQKIAGLYDAYYIDDAGAVDFYAMVEDEIILSLPIIAKHDDENCLSYNLYDSSSKKMDMIDKAYADALEQAKQENPFAVLGKLKN